MSLIEIETPHGPARAHVRAAPEPRGTLVLGHGAGGDVAARDLGAAGRAAEQNDMTVVLVEQPYRVAGRRSPASAAQLDTAWLAVVERLRADDVVRGLLVTGGRSSGARVACRTAATTGAAGVLCLAFPLQPPRRVGSNPPPSRLAELDAVTVPVLVVQGESDPFGMPPAAPRRTVVRIKGTHSLTSGPRRARRCRPQLVARARHLVAAADSPLGVVGARPVLADGPEGHPAQRVPGVWVDAAQVEVADDDHDATGTSARRGGRACRRGGSRVLRSPYQSSIPETKKSMAKAAVRIAFTFWPALKRPCGRACRPRQEAAVVAVEEVDLAHRCAPAPGGCRAATIRSIAPAHEMPGPEVDVLDQRPSRDGGRQRREVEDRARSRAGRRTRSRGPSAGAAR